MPIIKNLSPKRCRVGLRHLCSYQHVLRCLRWQRLRLRRWLRPVCGSISGSNYAVTGGNPPQPVYGRPRLGLCQHFSSVCACVSACVCARVATKSKGVSFAASGGHLRTSPPFISWAETARLFRLFRCSTRESQLALPPCLPGPGTSPKRRLRR